MAFVFICCPMLSYVVLHCPTLPYIALCYPKLSCIALRLKVEFLVGGVVVQTNNHVKPTTKLLWVAFGLGCCCLAWLWGYDNTNGLYFQAKTTCI